MFKLEARLEFYGVAENTPLLCKGRYHCTASLQFDWFGLSSLSIYK